MDNEIFVCHGPTCHKDAPDIVRNLKKELGRKARIQECSCLGLCGRSNNLSVNRKLIRIHQRENAVWQVRRELAKQKTKRNGPMTKDQAEDILGL